MTQTLEAEVLYEEASQGRPLQATLVELIELSLQAKQAHWNVTGMAFKPVHEFLDAIADEYREWYDTVAERMTALGIAPDGRSATVSATAGLAPMPAGPVADGMVLQLFDERVTDVASRIRDRAVVAGETDLATQDLFIELLRGLEKQRWMLRAHRS